MYVYISDMDYIYGYTYANNSYCNSDCSCDSNDNLFPKSLGNF